MGKRRNLNGRDNEVEGEGCGSNVTLSVIENGHNSAEESYMGAWEGANMRRENVNLEQPLARVQPAAPFQVMENRDENPVVIQQSEGIETDNEQAVGDLVGSRVSHLVYLDDILFHAKVFKSMRRKAAEYETGKLQIYLNCDR